MPQRKPPYPAEFRAEAMRLARTSGRPRAEIARDLGLTPETLRIWLTQDDRDAGRRSAGVTTEEGEELRSLSAKAGQLQYRVTAATDTALRHLPNPWGRMVGTVS